MCLALLTFILLKLLHLTSSAFNLGIKNANIFEYLLVRQYVLIQFYRKINYIL